MEVAAGLIGAFIGVGVVIVLCISGGLNESCKTQPRDGRTTPNWKDFFMDY